MDFSIGAGAGAGAEAGVGTAVGPARNTDTNFKRPAPNATAFQASRARAAQHSSGGKVKAGASASSMASASASSTPTIGPVRKQASSGLSRSETAGSASKTGYSGPSSTSTNSVSPTKTMNSNNTLSSIFGNLLGSLGSKGSNSNNSNSNNNNSSPRLRLWTLLVRLLRIAGGALGTAFVASILRYLQFLLTYKMAQNRKVLPLAPGPPPLPLVGSLPVVASYPGPDGNPLVHRALMDQAKKYGDKGILGLYLGASYTVVVTKPSVAEEGYMEYKLDSGHIPRGSITTDRAPNQSHGGHHVPTMNLFTRDGQGIAMSTGAYWKKVRGRLVAHITSPKVARTSAPMIQAEVQSVVRAWRLKSARQENIDNLRFQLKRESMNMAMRLLFSSRFGTNPPWEYERLQYFVGYFFQNLSSGNASDMIPLLRNLPNKFLDEFKANIDERDQVLGKIIKTHRDEFEQMRAEGKMNSRKDARDVCDMFLFDLIDGFEEEAADGTKTLTKLTEDEVHVCLWDILFAMTDTTATTNEWMVYHLCNNPDIQQKVQEELDRVVGPDRLPELEDKPNMPYFWAFMKEVFRFRIVSPLMAPHYPKEDMTLHDVDGKEYFIPRGTTMYLHGFSMGQDPEFWDEPQEFRPERWLEDPRNEGLDLHGQVRRKSVEHFKFIPFSMGPRMCPGYSFAQVAQFLQASTIAHCFTWKMSREAHKSNLVINGKLDMTETWGLNVMPQPFGEMGLIKAVPRPACRLAEPADGDVDYENRFLDRTRKEVKLLHRDVISHDTILLRFGFDFDKVLGLPPGKHFKVFMPNKEGKEPGYWNGHKDPEAGKETVERPYTPISRTEDCGYTDLVVKVYPSECNQRFPDGGKVSQQLALLDVGDEITICGPYGLIEYDGKSIFKLGASKQVSKNNVGMIAGGSGITPIYQVLQTALADPEDETKFSLIYANKTEDDILLREELEALREYNPTRLRIHYTLSNPPQGWEYSTGIVDTTMIATHMPPPDSEDTLILACGPPPMIQHAVKENCYKLGYRKEDIAAF